MAINVLIEGHNRKFARVALGNYVIESIDQVPQCIRETHVSSPNDDEKRTVHFILDVSIPFDGEMK